MNIFTGLYQLITSPSGLLAFLLMPIATYLSIKLGTSIPFTAYLTFIPTAIGYFEHREQVQMNAINAGQTPVILPNQRGRL